MISRGRVSRALNFGGRFLFPLDRRRPLLLGCSRSAPVGGGGLAEEGAGVELVRPRVLPPPPLANPPAPGTRFFAFQFFFSLFLPPPSLLFYIRRAKVSGWRRPPPPLFFFCCPPPRAFWGRRRSLAPAPVRGRGRRSRNTFFPPLLFSPLSAPRLPRTKTRETPGVARRCVCVCSFIDRLRAPISDSRQVKRSLGRLNIRPPVHLPPLSATRTHIRFRYPSPPPSYPSSA